MKAEPLVDGQLWTLHSPGNRFLGFIEIFNNALIIQVTKGLVVINPPSSKSKCIEAVRTLCHSLKQPLCAIVSPGDWHHFHLLTWAKAFPEANLYVASPRVLKKQPTLKERAIVLERTAPYIPEIESICTLIPWLGSKQPPWIMGGDRSGTDRVEHLVFHNATRTLFVTDHVLGPGVMGTSVSPNKGGFSSKKGDGETLKDSAQRVLDAGARRIVFSHGHKDAFIMGDGTQEAGIEIKERLAHAYQYFGL